jgi:hypothetical protein
MEKGLWGKPPQTSPPTFLAEMEKGLWGKPPQKSPPTFQII